MVATFPSHPCPRPSSPHSHSHSKSNSQSPSPSYHATSPSAANLANVRSSSASAPFLSSERAAPSTHRQQQQHSTASLQRSSSKSSGVASAVAAAVAFPRSSSQSSFSSGAGVTLPPAKRAFSAAVAATRGPQMETEALLSLFSRSLRTISVTLPHLFCRLVPQFPEALSLGSLYVFMQALGLLWIFTCSLLASMGTRLVTSVAAAPADGDLDSVGGAGLVLKTPCRAVAICYIYYCVVRMLALFGRGMWTATWEIYHNFPTMRRLLLRSRRAKTLTRAATEPSSSAARAASASACSGMAPSASLSTSALAGTRAAASATTATTTTTNASATRVAEGRGRRGSSQRGSRGSGRGSGRGEERDVREERGREGRDVVGGSPKEDADDESSGESSSLASSSSRRSSINSTGQSPARPSGAHTEAREDTRKRDVSCSPSASPSRLEKCPPASSASAVRWGSGSSSRVSQEGIAYQDVRRIVVLVAPLFLMVLFHVTLMLGQVICQRLGEDYACSKWHPFDSESPIRRGMLFVLVVGAVQWLQAWTAIFPEWHIALSYQDSLAKRMLLTTWSCLLLPASLMRLSASFAQEGGLGPTRYLSFLLRHQVYDSILAIGWSLWLLFACALVTQVPAIRHSGFSANSLRDDEKWKAHCNLFKFTLFASFGIAYFQGFAVGGVVQAQNDLIVVTMCYPCLICLVWTFTYMLVSMTRYTVIDQRTFGQSVTTYTFGLLLLTLLATGLCALADRGSRPIMIILVWMHLCQQSFRIAWRWVRWTSRRSSSTKRTSTAKAAAAAAAATNATKGGGDDGGACTEKGSNSNGNGCSSSIGNNNSSNNNNNNSNSACKSGSTSNLLGEEAMSGGMSSGREDQELLWERERERLWSSAAQLYFALDPARCPDLRKSYLMERRLGRVAVRIMMLMMLAFCSIIVVCLCMAHIQARAGWLSTDLVTWKPFLSTGIEFTTADSSVLRLVQTDSVTQSPPVDLEEEPVYAVCSHRWHGLQMIDYALLSLISYMDRKDGTGLEQGLVERLWPHRVANLSKVGNNIHRRWVEVEFSDCSPTTQGNSSCSGDTVSVIAVSGTDPTRVIDFAEDLRMWVEPFCLQFLAMFFPTMKIWPRGTSALIVGGIHGIMAELEIQDDEWHYLEILEYVRQIPKHKKVVLTGHSLGGGIALIISALTGRLAVAVQPPGVYHSLAKHLALQANAQWVSREAVHEKSISLVVDGDWIQNFDAHGGLVQTINCDEEHRATGMGCHLLEGAICHLLLHCGDRAQRFSACEHEWSSSGRRRRATGAGKLGGLPGGLGGLSRNLEGLKPPTFGGAAAATAHFVEEGLVTSELESHLDSVLVAGLLVSLFLIARYGVPVLSGRRTRSTSDS